MESIACVIRAIDEDSQAGCSACRCFSMLSWSVGVGPDFFIASTVCSKSQVIRLATSGERESCWFADSEGTRDFGQGWSDHFFLSEAAAAAPAELLLAGGSASLDEKEAESTTLAPDLPADAGAAALV
jgi:hypothetical protein